MLKTALIVFILMVAVASLFIFRHVSPKAAIVHVTQPTMPVESKDNLAGQGGFILASSFDDVKQWYTDNLIDRNPLTMWRPKEREYPQWIELRWRYPLRLNRMAFEDVSSNRVQAVTVLGWTDDAWKPVKSAGEKELGQENHKSVSFAEITTQRLRLVLEKGEGGFPQLAEVEAYGPPQPQVGKNKPYWDAWYIWYPEPDKVHKTGPRYFRKVFEITDLDAMQSAFIQARANDYYKIYVNGTDVATGSTTITPVNVKHCLHNGKNIIAAVSDLSHNPGQWGWGEMLIELSMNYQGRAVRIGTDKTWKSHAELVAGWEKSDFNDADWKEAAPYTRPPDGPWGEIAYHCTFVREKAVLVKTDIAPAAAKQGSVVDVSAILSVPERLKRDYFFVFDLAEKNLPGTSDDYFVAGAVTEPVKPTTSWKTGEQVTVGAHLRLPAFAPNGEIPLIIKAFDKETGIALALSDSTGKPLDSATTLKVMRLAQDKSQAESKMPPAACISFENNQASFSINGQHIPPVFPRYLSVPSFERFYYYSHNTGMHLHYIILYPRALDNENSLDIFNQRIMNILRVDPEAYLIVAMDVRPSKEWLKNHPEEKLINAFGKEGEVISFASKAYENRVNDYLRRLIAFVQSKPYANRVIAYHPMACGVPDSGMGGVEGNLWQPDRAKLTVGDYNPQALNAFREWLHAKYGGSVERLRAAWQDKTVTFESARPVRDELLREGKKGGVFRDPTEGRMTFDYFEFLPRLLGRFNQVMAKTVKEATGGKAIFMTHYGYVVEHLRGYNMPGGRFQNNNFDFPEMLNDPNIDIYLGAPNYDFRRAGDPYVLYFPLDSITLNRRQYVADGDYRTFIAAALDRGRHRSRRETDMVLKRDFASMMIGNSGSWLADMSGGTGRGGLGWFLDEGNLGTLKRINEIFTDALKTPRKSASEIAVFISMDTPRYEDAYYAPPLYQNLIQRFLYGQMHIMGAPFDVFMMNDLRHPDLRKDYKMYVFINPFYMSDDDRKAVEALKSGGKTLLWFYAPGYIDNNRGLSPAHITEVTGIKVAEKPDKERMRCTISSNAHPVTKGLPPGQVYETVGYGNPKSEALHPSAWSPVFFVDDTNAVVLGNYGDGKPAFAARDFKEWKSVYMAVPYLDAPALRNIARWAGVHLYAEENIVMDADNRFLMVHNGYNDGRKVKIALPNRKKITEIFSGKVVTEGADNFEADMSECDTKVYHMQDIP